MVAPLAIVAIVPRKPADLSRIDHDQPSLGLVVCGTVKYQRHVASQTVPYV
jgi:hypothetical protein